MSRASRLPLNAHCGGNESDTEASEVSAGYRGRQAGNRSY